MKKLVFLISSLLIACSASAAVLDTNTYGVTDLSGSWSNGSTGWNMYPSTPTISSANTLLSDGYVDNFSHQTINGIYSGYPTATSSITFGTIGGVDVLLNSFSFITSRNYDNSTTLLLQYSLNNGAWSTAESITTSLLFAPLSSCLSSAGNDCAGQTATMSFGGVLADQWRLTLNGGQVSFHEVIIDADAVPEPASLALLGLGLAGLASARRKKAA